MMLLSGEVLWPRLAERDRTGSVCGTKEPSRPVTPPPDPTPAPDAMLPLTLIPARLTLCGPGTMGVVGERSAPPTSARRTSSRAISGP